MTSHVPNIKVPIIKNGISNIDFLDSEFINKKVILFGVPGAFTPTCSEKHLPGYIKFYNQFKNKNIDDIYCLSVNDEHVMKSWLLSYADDHNIHGIADGNADITSYFNLLTDKSKNYMGKRCNRFSMLIINNKIEKLYIEKSGEFNVSSAETIFKEL
jgi:peroxiredoxin